MEVCHADEAADDCDDAPKFNFVITTYATREVVCDLAVKSHHKKACDCDGDAAKEPAPAECPLHKQNYSTTKPCADWNYLVK